MSSDVTIIIEDGGALGGGGPLPPPPPHGDLFWYADIPGSISADADGVVSAWGTAATATGTPLLITDSVTGQKAIRFGAGDKLTTAVGAADFLTTGESTAILIFRTRHPLYSPAYGAVDTSGNGAGKGYQLQFNQVIGQRLIPRVHDASTWILDASGTEQGQYIDQKWTIAVVRLTATNYDVRFDGQFIAVGGTTIAITLPGATGRGLSIGDGPIDVLGMELYSSRLSDSATAAAETRLVSRFGLDVLQVIGGDPTLTTNVSALFPYMSKLPSGKLYVTMFRGTDETPHDANFVEDRVSADHGLTWGTPRTILQSNSSIRYSDTHTTEPLSDGTVFQHWFIYDGLNNIQTKLQWRKSTGFNADGSPIWAATVDLPVAGVDWVASGAQMVEDPFNNGHYHLPAFALQTGHTNENIYDIQSTNSGSTWSVVKVADGDTDALRYAENAFLFDSAGVIFCMTRAVGANQAYETHSTDNGATWATPVTSSAGFTSSAQGFRKLASGAYIEGPARTVGSFNQSSMFWRAPGTAWNGQWTSPPNTPFVDPFFGGNYYGGNYEYSPGLLAMVFGRSSSNNSRNNVSARTNFHEWYLTHTMPGSATPSTASVSVSTSHRIELRGAGDYTCVFDTNASGANVVVSGNHATYTAGSSNGVDLFHFLDTNSKTIQSCTYTVSGATTIDPTTLPGANLVLRADHATNTGNGTPVTAWSDEMGLHNMQQPTSGDRFTWNATGINGKPDVSSTGTPRAMFSDQAALGTTALGLGVCFEFTASGVDQFLFGARFNNYHYDIGTDGTNAGQIVFRINTDAGLFVIKSDSTALNDGNRHTVFGSWDGATMTMYVDGVAQTMTLSATGTIVAPSTNNDNNSIGGTVDGTNAPGNGFAGSIKGANSTSQAINPASITGLTAWYAAL